MTVLRYENIDVEADKYHYYTIQVQPDLFGFWSLIREWGRIGSKRGTVMITPFDSEDEAIADAKKLIKRRISQGYEPIDTVA